MWLGSGSALSGLDLAQVVGSCLRSQVAVPRGRVNNTALRGGYGLLRARRALMFRLISLAGVK